MKRMGKEEWGVGMKSGEWRVGSGEKRMKSREREMKSGEC